MLTVAGAGARIAFVTQRMSAPRGRLVFTPPEITGRPTGAVVTPVPDRSTRRSSITHVALRRVFHLLRLSIYHPHSARQFATERGAESSSPRKCGKDQRSTAVLAASEEHTAGFDRFSLPNVRCLRCDHVGYVLNNLNRGLGLPDSYPFILTPRVIDKIVFVQRTVFEAKVTE